MDTLNQAYFSIADGAAWLPYSFEALPDDSDTAIRKVAQRIADCTGCQVKANREHDAESKLSFIANPRS